MWYGIEEKGYLECTQTTKYDDFWYYHLMIVITSRLDDEVAVKNLFTELLFCMPKMWFCCSSQGRIRRHEESVHEWINIVVLSVRCNNTVDRCEKIQKVSFHVDAEHSTKRQDAKVTTWKRPTSINS